MLKRSAVLCVVGVLVIGTAAARCRCAEAEESKAAVTTANFTRIRQFILDRGKRQTYCNMFNNNPYWPFAGFNAYLNPPDQRNINCEIGKSVFNHLVIVASEPGRGTQYWHIRLDAQAGALQTEKRHSAADASAKRKEVAAFFEKALAQIDRWEGFHNALQSRVLLGQIGNDGTPASQVAWLYDAPSQDADHPFFAWSGAEARPLDGRDTEWRCVEVPAALVKSPRKTRPASDPYVAWVPAKDVRALGEIMEVLTTQRLKSGVACDLLVYPRLVRQGASFTADATFTNKTDAVRTVHFEGVRVRHARTSAPLALQVDSNEVRTENIPPRGSIKIRTQGRIPDHEQAPPGYYQVYAVYSLRKGPNGPIPVRMVSHFHEMELKE